MWIEEKVKHLLDKPLLSLTYRTNSLSLSLSLFLSLSLSTPFTFFRPINRLILKRILKSVCTNGGCHSDMQPILLLSRCHNFQLTFRKNISPEKLTCIALTPASVELSLQIRRSLPAVTLQSVSRLLVRDSTGQANYQPSTYHITGQRYKNEP